MHALIDGDIVVYRIGWTTEQEDWPIARWRTDKFIDDILVNTSAKSFEVFLSDSTENNFRYKIYPLYKANRKQPKPKHYDRLKEYIVDQYDAIITAEQEADDALGINQREDTIICTIDKDLKQVPGNHYHFVNNIFDVVSEEEGLQSFYRQILTGDVIDNITGIYGVGPVKSKAFLKDCQTEEELFNKCLDLYEDNGLDIYQFYLNGILLKIRRKAGEIWNFPESFRSLQPSMDDLLSYIQIKEKEITQSTELTSTENTG